MTLKEVKPGQKAVITAVLAEGAYKRRIVAMGITPGTEVAVIKAAPLGDPIEIEVRGSQLSLRKEEISCIEVSVR